MQTSINIQPCKVTASERHNKREKLLSYTRPELSHLNEWYNTLDVHLKSYDARLRKLIKAKTGRACQAKSHPLHEAVVVIRPDTTIEDIKKLADAMASRWGFHFVQMAIHKDEGHWKNGIWKPNLHAHMVFDKIDHETGKTIKTTKADTAEMQDMCAEVLHMERGKKGSTAQHLDALSYKIAAEGKRAEAQTKAIALQSILGGLAIHAAKQEQEAIESRTRGLDIIQKNLSKDISGLLVEVKTKSEERDRLALSAKNMGRILEHNTEEAKKKALINERLSEEGKSLREEKERLRSDILGLTAQKEEIGSEAESLAGVVQAARSDLSHLNAQKIAVSGEILNLNQERDKAQREAEEAKAQKRAAEAEAAKGLAVGAAKKLGNVLGFGSEAKQLKELPKQLETARAEGKKAAIAEILDVAKLNFGDKEVTPEMIGKAWRSRWDEAKNARAETERQVKNATAHASIIEKMLDALVSLPIIRACVHAIVAFVRQGSRSFDTEDTALLRTALDGDPSNAKALRQIAYYNGGAYAQPHLSSYWDRAEKCMEKIARGENQEQDQGRSQSRGLHF